MTEDVSRSKSIYLTKKEYDILLFLRKKHRSIKRLRRRFRPRNDDHLNIWLSDLHTLYYVEPDGAKVLEAKSIHLNEIGMTIAQAEYDRRFDMYFKRILTVLSLVLSIVAIIVSVVLKLWPEGPALPPS